MFEEKGVCSERKDDNVRDARVDYEGVANRPKSSKEKDISGVIAQMKESCILNGQSMEDL